MLEALNTFLAGVAPDPHNPNYLVEITAKYHDGSEITYRKRSLVPLIQDINQARIESYAWRRFQYEQKQMLEQAENDLNTPQISGETFREALKKQEEKRNQSKES